ncbi:MAG: hypothetical protein Q9225_005690 [Loekoesia sp. 1 TL-2023]
MADYRIPESLQVVQRPTSSRDWDKHRKVIERLYVEEDKSLPAVVEELEKLHGFAATERQYKRRISEWRLDKNVKEDEMKAIIATEATRLRQGKQSAFYVRGRQVHSMKIKRFAQRKRIDRSNCAGDTCTSLPPGVRCITPPTDVLKNSSSIPKKSSVIITQQLQTISDKHTGNPEREASFSAPLSADHWYAHGDNALDTEPTHKRPRTRAAKSSGLQPLETPLDSATADVYQDVLYNRSITTSAPAQQPEQHIPEENFLSPQKSTVVSKLLQAAKNEHVITRSASPTSIVRERSPFTPGSLYADERFSHSTPNSLEWLISAAWIGEQQKAESDALARVEHQPRSNKSVVLPTTTILPKDVMLDFKEAEEDVEVPFSNQNNRKEQILPSGELPFGPISARSGSQSDVPERSDVSQTNSDRRNSSKSEQETHPRDRAQTFLLQGYGILLDQGLPDNDRPVSRPQRRLDFIPLTLDKEMDAWRWANTDTPQAFDKDGYYATPVAVNLLSLPSFLRQRHIDAFYFHFFMDNTARLLGLYDRSNNNLKEILTKMVLRNDSLLALLLIFSASHRACLLGFPQPTNRIALWAQEVFPGLRHVLTGLRHVLTGHGPWTSPSNDDFAIAIMLASLEIVCPNVFRIPFPWRDRLETIGRLYEHRNTALTGNRLFQEDELEEVAFLTRWYYNIFVMDALSEPQTSKPSRPSFTRSSEYFDFYTHQLMNMLSTTAGLIRRYEADKVETWSNSCHILQSTSPIIGLCRDIVLDCCDFESAKAWFEGTKGRAMQKLYSWAAIILIYRRVEGRPISDTAVQCYVREIFEAVKLAGLKGVNLGILFPLFIAGCEAETSVQRQFLSDRFDKLEKLGMAHIDE